MEPRDLFRAGLELSQAADDEYSESLNPDRDDHMDSVARAAALAQMAASKGLLAWASLLGADADPAQQLDTYDPATRAPVVSISGRKTAASVAPETADEWTRLPGKEPEAMTSIHEYDESFLEKIRRDLEDSLSGANDWEARAAGHRADARADAASAARFRRDAAQYRALLDHAEGKPSTTPKPDPADARAAVVAGVREFADFLEENPDLPLNDTLLHHFPRAADVADEVAEVNRIAAILGVEAARQNDVSPHHVARRTFGPITYEATVCNVYDLDAPAEDAKGGASNE